MTGNAGFRVRINTAYIRSGTAVRSHAFQENLSWTTYRVSIMDQYAFYKNNSRRNCPYAQCLSSLVLVLERSRVLLCGFKCCYRVFFPIRLIDAAIDSQPSVLNTYSTKFPFVSNHIRFIWPTRLLQRTKKKNLIKTHWKYRSFYKTNRQ